MVTHERVAFPYASQVITLADGRVVPSEEPALA
jgi:hypothetical protein